MGISVGQIILGAPPRYESTIFLGWTGSTVPNGKYLYGAWTVPTGGGTIVSWATYSRGIFGTTSPGWEGEVLVNGATVLSYTKPTPVSTTTTGIDVTVTPISLADGDWVEFKMHGPCDPVSATVAIRVMLLTYTIVPIGPILLP